MPPSAADWAKIPGCEVKTALEDIALTELGKPHAAMYKSAEEIIVKNWYTTLDSLKSVTWSELDVPGFLVKCLKDLAPPAVSSGSGPKGGQPKLEAPKSVYAGKGSAAGFEQWKREIGLWKKRYPTTDEALLCSYLLDAIDAEIKQQLHKVIPATELDLPSAFDTVMKYMKKNYGQRDDDEAYWAHKDFKECRREKKRLRDYLTEWESKLAHARLHGMTEQDSFLWLDALNGSCLNATQYQNVTAQKAQKKKLMRDTLRLMGKDAEADVYEVTLEESIDILKELDRSFENVSERKKEIKVMVAEKGQGKGDKKDVTCHKCGKKGHYARDCKSKGDGKGGKGKKGGGKGTKGDASSGLCFKCGKPGHRIAECKSTGGGAQVGGKGAKGGGKGADKVCTSCKKPGHVESDCFFKKLNDAKARGKRVLVTEVDEDEPEPATKRAKRAAARAAKKENDE
jgi:hypothetical protein